MPIELASPRFHFRFVSLPLMVTESCGFRESLHEGNFEELNLTRIERTHAKQTPAKQFELLQGMAARLDRRFRGGQRKSPSPNPAFRQDEPAPNATPKLKNRHTRRLILTTDRRPMSRQTRGPASCDAPLLLSRILEKCFRHK